MIENPKQQAVAHKFTLELCGNNVDAIEFCTLWYRYCHGIDDLIDTMEDSRPTMNSEQILELFGLAALLYNSNFFINHRGNLFPLVIMVTNMYCDSVLWEKSNIPRRRIMADVMRTCGNEMLLMVAIIVGGWQHMRNMSQKFRDTDWIMQHDENDKPN